MNKNNALIASSALALVLSACSSSSGLSYVDAYTVIWQNDDGTILEIDRGVKEGEMPSYDGATPLKEGDELHAYSFKGWDKELLPVSENVSFTATYEVTVQAYTVIWKNYDGTLLEIDREVPHGQMPSYDGEVPRREQEGTLTYRFNGWTPALSPVTKDIEYVATYKEIKTDEPRVGYDPFISSDGKTVQYGFYPQSHVSDEAIIEELEKITEKTENGWVEYLGDYYFKKEASVYNGEHYVFDDGVSIVDGDSYWFSCSPIAWDVLSYRSGEYLLASSLLLDSHSFDDDYGCKSYLSSDARSWLNGGFMDNAFFQDGDYLNSIAVDGESDKVSLLSRDDLLNADYGFDEDPSKASDTRTAKTSDYDRANGAWCSKDAANLHNGSYWTRTVSAKYDYAAWNVNSAGYLSQYGLAEKGHSIRPVISISIVF